MTTTQATPPKETSTARADAPTVELKTTSIAPPIDLDDWELQEDLRFTDQFLTSIGVPDPSDVRKDQQRQDDNHGSLHAPLLQPPAMRSLGSQTQHVQTKRRHGPAILSWAALSLGLMAFACGGVLLGWSFVADRGDLWRVGMPLTLLGQAALIFGLVLQLEGLWQTNRDTTDTLDELDHQLHDLKHATTLMSTTHSSAAQSFYSHMADGAQPNLLLADLKGQLDMLAMKMSKRGR